MSEILVYNDEDWRNSVIAKQWADDVGKLLATTYPGYRWYVEPKILHGKLDVVRISCITASGTWGVYLNPELSCSETEWRRTVVMKGGEILEHFELRRDRFGEGNYLDMLGRKTFAGIILPVM